MVTFIVRRLGWALFVVAAVIVIVFLLMHAVGDPASAMLGPNAKKQQLDDFRRKYGLDQPQMTQFLGYLGVGRCVRPTSPRWSRDPGQRGYCGLLQGDLGESFANNEPVARVIMRRMPRTILLGAMAIAFEVLIGLTFGVLAATRHNTYLDTGLMAASFLGTGLPTFVTGPIALWLLAFLLGWFPVGGYGVGFWDHVYHATLPALTLAIGGAATYARVMRSEMLETLRADYVRTARAKGLGPFRVVVVHAVRNALLPIATMVGLSLAFLVSGAIITEGIFAWPGMGSLAIKSITMLDTPTIMGVVLVFSVAVQVGNLLADVVVALLDPRVRLGSS